MSTSKVSQRITLVGFFLGFALTYVSPFKEYLWSFQKIFYAKTMVAWQFGLIWGLVFSGILYGGFMVLKNKGHRALIALVALVGLFYLLFSLLPYILS